MVAISKERIFFLPILPWWQAFFWKSFSLVVDKFSSWHTSCFAFGLLNITKQLFSTSLRTSCKALKNSLALTKTLFSCFFCTKTLSIQNYSKQFHSGGHNHRFFYFRFHGKTLPSVLQTSNCATKDRNRPFFSHHRSRPLRLRLSWLSSRSCRRCKKGVGKSSGVSPRHSPLDLSLDRPFLSRGLFSRGRGKVGSKER